MKKHGVYAVYDENGQLRYIGTTALSLKSLEFNHRNWHRKGFSSTQFRQALIKDGQNWQFEWLEPPREVSRDYIEIVEGALIRILKPIHNKDRYPYETSVKRGRSQIAF